MFPSESQRYQKRTRRMSLSQWLWASYSGLVKMDCHKMSVWSDSQADPLTPTIMSLSRLHSRTSLMFKQNRPFLGPQRPSWDNPPQFYLLLMCLSEYHSTSFLKASRPTEQSPQAEGPSFLLMNTPDTSFPSLLATERQELQGQLGGLTQRHPQGETNPSQQCYIWTEVLLASSHQSL